MRRKSRPGSLNQASSTRLYDSLLVGVSSVDHLEDNHPIALNEVKNPIITHPETPKRFEFRSKRLAVIRRCSPKTIFDRRLDAP